MPCHAVSKRSIQYRGRQLTRSGDDLVTDSSSDDTGSVDHIPADVIEFGKSNEQVVRYGRRHSITVYWVACEDLFDKEWVSVGAIM
jgi:hypothetical protein